MSEPSATNTEPGVSDIWTAQITVLMCAVEAIIATNPNPNEVRRIFDQLLGQIQAGLLVSGTTPLGIGLMRQIAEKIFSPPVTGH